MRKTLAILLILIPASQGASAADWTILQTANISAPTFSMSQRESESSRQAVNSSVLGADDALSSVTQTTTFNTSNFTLTQSGSGASENVQAINLASAPSIAELEQTVENFATATLTQDITGSSNTQAINYAVAVDTISDATQEVRGNTITVTKEATTPAGNIQAVNYMQAQRYTGTISQTLDLTQSLTPNDLSVRNSGIRINSINGDISDATAVSQTVKVRSVEVNSGDFSDAFSTVILNHISP